MALTLLMKTASQGEVGWLVPASRLSSAAGTGPDSSLWLTSLVLPLTAAAAPGPEAQTQAWAGLLPAGGSSRLPVAVGHL